MQNTPKNNFSFKEGKLSGGFFLLNIDKYKSGKKKGQYKYLKMVGLDWNKKDGK